MSHIFHHSKSWSRWGIKPIFGDVPCTVRPSISIAPPLRGSRPAMALSRVDLPQPEGPTKLTNAPSSTVKDTSRTASTSPSGA